MKRVGFVISNSQVGGAEISLLRTLEAMDRSRFEPLVCVTGQRGALHAQYARLAELIDPGQLDRADVLNIVNHLAWARGYWERRAGSAGPPVIQHVYMHPDILFWGHFGSGAYQSLLHNFFLCRFVVCDSSATAMLLEQQVCLLHSLHPEDYGKKRLDKIPVQDRLKLVRHGAGSTALAREAAAPTLRPRRCLWVGAANWTKGFDRLPALVDAHPGISFEIVVKSEPAAGGPERLVFEDLRGRENVAVHVGLPGHRLRELAEACDAYLSTSRREGRSVAWEEAKAAGLPCTDAGGPAEVPDKAVVDDIGSLWS